VPGNFPRKAERKFREASDPKSFERGILGTYLIPLRAERLIFWATQRAIEVCRIASATAEHF
jgi:hypothetical protein